jgi:hypothetical protein
VATDKEAEELPNAEDIARCASQPCNMPPFWVEHVQLATIPDTKFRIGFLCNTHKIEAEYDSDRFATVIKTHRELMRRLNGGGRLPRADKVFFSISGWG